MADLGHADIWRERISNALVAPQAGVGGSGGLRPHAAGPLHWRLGGLEAWRLGGEVAENSS